MDKSEGERCANDTGRKPDGEQRFRELFEHAPLCVFEENLTSDPPRILRANLRCVETYGWSQQEFAGLEVHYLIPPQAQADFPPLQETLRAGKNVTFESFNCRRDGSVFPVRLSASPVKGTNRSIIMVEDITTERRAGATARALLNATHDRAVLLDLEGVILDLNEEAARSLGATPKELRGKDITTLFPEELARRRTEHAESVLRTGQPRRWQDVREGSVLENCLYPVFDEHGRVTGMAGFARDITNQQQAREALEKARQRLQHIVDNTWDIIFQMDLSGNYTFGNKAAERITGYRLDQLLTMNFTQLIAPEYVPMVRQRLRGRIEGRDLPQPFAFEFIRADGQRVPLELSTTGVYEDGKLVGVQGIARDITERHRAEKALQKAHSKLMTAREDERRRVAQELHDSVGQQLVALRLLLKNALNECDQGQVETAHRHLVSASETSNSLVGEIRDICQGLYPATLESLGLPAALRDLCAQCAKGQDKRRCVFVGPAVDTRLPPEIEIALFRVAQEALSNALRHAHAESVRFGLETHADHVILRVTDDGVGFDPDSINGNGIGLSSMTERVESLGGTLNLESRSGHTELTATVPLPADATD